MKLLFNNPSALLKKLRVFYVTSLLAATVLVGCAPIDDLNMPEISTNKITFNNPSPKIESFEIDRYKIMSGDELSIEVFGESELTRPSITVANSGEIDFPLIGKVNLLGKTLQEASKEIKTKLAQGFLYQPQVSVKIENHRPVVVTGVVEEAGLYDYTSGMTYRMLLILADEGQYEWPIDDIVVQRNNIRGMPASIDDTLAPGDLVIFKSSGEGSDERFFYVDGEVKSPGKYEIESGLTIEQAIISAGGMTIFGSRNRVFVRPDGEGKLRKARLTDLVVAGNVILVKQSLF